MPVCDAVAEGYAGLAKQFVLELLPEIISGDVSPRPVPSLYMSTNAVPASRFWSHVVDLAFIKGG